MQRHFRPNLAKLYRHDGRPDNAGWKYLPFAVAALEATQTLEDSTGNEECVIVSNSRSRLN